MQIYFFQINKSTKSIDLSTLKSPNHKHFQYRINKTLQYKNITGLLFTGTNPVGKYPNTSQIVTSPFGSSKYNPISFLTQKISLLQEYQEGQMYRLHQSHTFSPSLLSHYTSEQYKIHSELFSLPLSILLLFQKNLSIH